MGFTSLMMDGSLMPDGKTPSTFEYNVEATRTVVEMAHPKGVTVEGEIGCLGGIEDGHGAGLDVLSRLTDPAQAEEFVKLTGLDALAIAIGTSHGAYKFTQKPTGETLKMARLIAIHKRLPNVHLVMHGSSSVPKNPQDIIKPVRRKAETHLGRAGRRNPARHQERRPQDQHRHRQSSRHHRRDPQGVRRVARKIRPTRLHEAGSRSDEEGGRRAHGAIRPGRTRPATTRRSRSKRWPPVISRSRRNNSRAS
jgi:hypothetical protein